MKVGTGLIISLVAIIALVAEVVLYFLVGLGAALAGGTQAASGIAFLFVGLMILTGALGLLAPICAVIELLTKKANLGYYLLLPSLVLVGTGYVGLAVLGRSTSSHRRIASSSVIPTPSLHQTTPAADSTHAAPTVDPYLTKVKLRNVTVGMSVLDEPGVWGEVKNTGDRSLDQVEITIFFLDRAGRRIHEKTYRPVFVSEFSHGDASTPLKPGYSRKFGVKANDAPSDWAKKVEIIVSDVALSK